MNTSNPLSQRVPIKKKWLLKWNVGIFEVKENDIICQDLKYRSFYISVCLSVRALYATVLITQTCRSIGCIYVHLNAVFFL